VVRQSIESAPALVAACALVVVGCYGPEPIVPAAAVVVAGSSGASSNGSAPSGGVAALLSYCNEHDVGSPPGGAPSLIDTICSATAEPVLADGAAELRLTVTDHDERLPAMGTLTFPEELRGQVQGAPVISVAGQYMLDATVSVPEQTADGYSFTVTFGPSAMLFANDRTRLSLRAAFDFGCEAGSRLVHAGTELRLCGGAAAPVTWSGPGETCVVCYEVQPASPVTPDTEAAHR